jgi:hypothetical protein
MEETCDSVLEVKYHPKVKMRLPVSLGSNKASVFVGKVLTVYHFVKLENFLEY